MANEVKILFPSLEEDDDGQLVIRGVVDQTTLKNIGFGWYQRERGFSPKHSQQIINGYLAGDKMADITLGMRGARTKDITAADGVPTTVLLDKTFCINGGQRIYSAAAAMKENPDLVIRLGAKIILNTTEATENALFSKLGTTEVRISASILMRNQRKDSPAVNMLVNGLSKDGDFAMNGRVCWDQSRPARDLITGFALARVVGALHSHKVGGLKTSATLPLVDALDRLVEKVGVDNVNDNLIRFFDTIDKVWQIRTLQSSRNVPHLKTAILLTLAQICSNYSEFWDGTEREFFSFPEKYLRRLKGFKLAEYVRSTSGQHRDVLYEILRKRLNLNPIFVTEPDEEAAGD